MNAKNKKALKICIVAGIVVPISLAIIGNMGEMEGTTIHGVFFCIIAFICASYAVWLFIISIRSYKKENIPIKKIEFLAPILAVPIYLLANAASMYMFSVLDALMDSENSIGVVLLSLMAWIWLIAVVVILFVIGAKSYIANKKGLGIANILLGCVFILLCIASL
jgi:threonine/homoserine/homoserine lactone efflux protein